MPIIAPLFSLNFLASPSFPNNLSSAFSLTQQVLNIITSASSHNITIDTITTITKSEFKIYSLTVLVENTIVLDKFCKDLNNLGFINKVERQVN